MRRKAKNIKFDLCIGRGFDSEFPVEEEIAWLSQFYPNAYCGYSYLIEGGNNPVRVWEHRNEFRDPDNLNEYYTLVWEDECAHVEE